MPKAKNIVTFSRPTRQDDTDVSGHLIPKGSIGIMGTVAKVNGKNVWSLDCNWCILNNPVASKVVAGADNPATETAPQPLVGILDPVTAPIPAPAVAAAVAAMPIPAVAPVAPATALVVAPATAPALPDSALVEFGKLLLAEMRKMVAEIPAQPSTYQIGLDLVAEGSLTQSIAKLYGLELAAPAVVATVRTPNPVAPGTTLCPAVIASGKRQGEVCEEVVKNPSNSHCGRHHQQNVVSSDLDLYAAPVAPVDPAAVAAAAFAELQTIPLT